MCSGVLDAENGQAECGLGDEFKKIGPTAHKVCELIAYADGFSDVCFESIKAVATHDKPYLQRAESTTKRNAPVAVVDHLAGFGVRVAQVRGCDVQGIGKVESVANEETASVSVSTDI